MNRSVIQTLAITFLQSVGFSIILPSLTDYILDNGGSKGFVGWVIAAYSLGQFLASPVFGYYSDYRSTKETIAIGLFISVVGNVYYSLAEYLPQPKYQLAVARFVTGVGVGAVSVCRAYVSHATSGKERNKLMSFMSAAQGVGFAIGPGFSVVTAHLEFSIKGFTVDKYTSPGYLSAIFALVPLVLLYTLGFQECERGKTAPLKRTDELEEEPFSRKIAEACCLFMFFVVIGVFAIFETIAVSMTKDQFQWSTVQNGLLFLAAGVESIIFFVLVGLPVVTKRFSDRQLLLIGWVVLCFALTFMIVWPFENDEFPLWQFVLGSVFITAGYPIVMGQMLTIYSKILHPVAQGGKMGIFTAAGSLSRMVGPIFASTVYDLYGQTSVFAITVGMVGLATSSNLACYHLLTPHPEYIKYCIQQASTEGSPSSATTTVASPDTRKGDDHPQSVVIESSEESDDDEKKGLLVN